MKLRWWTVLLAAALCTGFVLVTCGDDDDDDDNDNNDDNDTIADDDDYPDNLLPCDPYYELEAWFEPISSASEGLKSFFDAFGDNFATGIVAVNDNTFALHCGGWSFVLRWLATNPAMPFTDGQLVQVYLGEYLEGELYQPSPMIWVLDEEGETLLYHNDRSAQEFGQIGSHSLIFGYDYSCEYAADQAPPEPQWAPWRLVFGRDVTGSLDGHVFAAGLWNPDGQTLDGELLVHLPYNYFGRVDTEERADDRDFQHHGAALLQFVRAAQ